MDGARKAADSAMPACLLFFEATTCNFRENTLEFARCVAEYSQNKMPKQKTLKSDAPLFQTKTKTAAKTGYSTAKVALTPEKKRVPKRNVRLKEIDAEHEQKLDKLRQLAQPTGKEPYSLKETYQKILEKLEFRYKQKPTFCTLQELLEALKPAITGDEMQQYVAIDPKIPPVLVWAPLKNKWIAGYTLCEIVREYMQWNETKHPDSKIIAQVKKSHVLQMDTLQIENEEPLYRFLINNKLY